jgi:hypothetical protein
MRFFLIGALLASSLAFAQQRVKEIKEGDWEPDIVSGSLTAPDVTQIDATKRPPHESLLRIRTDFKDKVRKSAPM